MERVHWTVPDNEQFDMDNSFDIIIAKEEDHTRLCRFMNEYFIKGEPLNMAVSHKVSPEDNSLYYPLETLLEGTSLIAVTKKEGDILGVCLNKTKSKSDENEYDDGKFGRFLNKVEGSVDIWSLTGTDRALNVYMIAVSDRAQGRGIGKALVEHSRELARSKGFPLLYMLCSSFYSAKIARKVGMQCVYSLQYSEYKDEQGIPVFLPPEPHKEIASFIQKL
ncbi:Dopamine N-acetyltransferase [Blattella germanica]|nr:Dopamine N-acetyltransferase [Blattella germanica]